MAELIPNRLELIAKQGATQVENAGCTRGRPAYARTLTALSNGALAASLAPSGAAEASQTAIGALEPAARVVLAEADFPGGQLGGLVRELAGALAGLPKHLRHSVNQELFVSGLP